MREITNLCSLGQSQVQKVCDVTLPRRAQTTRLVQKNLYFSLSAFSCLSLHLGRAGWLGAAAAGSIPAAFSIFSTCLLFLSSFFQRPHYFSLTKFVLSWRFSAAFLFSSAGESWLLYLSPLLSLLSPSSHPPSTVSVRTMTKILLNRPSGLSD